MTHHHFEQMVGAGRWEAPVGTLWVGSARCAWPDCCGDPHEGEFCGGCAGWTADDCERCGEPFAGDVVRVAVVRVDNGRVIDKRICHECDVSLRRWFLGAPVGAS